MSYYPEGVTGNEDKIAGPRDEREFKDNVTCEECGHEGEAVITEIEWSDTINRTWTCAQCEYEHEEEETF